MSVIIYKPSESANAAYYAEQLEAMIDDPQVTVSDTYTNFLLNLTLVGLRDTVLVLLLKSMQDLREMLSLKDLLLDHRCVLVLDDTDEELVAGVHSLYPRFVTSFNSAPEEVVVIVGNLLKSDKQTRNYPPVEQRVGKASVSELRR